MMFLIELTYGADKYDSYITIKKDVAKKSIISKSNAKSHYVWRLKKHGGKSAKKHQRRKYTHDT